MSSSNPPNFPLFVEFLKEIQVIIFRHASHLYSPEYSTAKFGINTEAVTIDTSNLFHNHLRSMIHLRSMARYKNRTRTFVKLVGNSPFITRYNMMGTILLARQVAIEDFREDVGEVPTEEHGNNVKNILIVWLNIQLAITKGKADIRGRMINC